MIERNLTRAVFDTNKQMFGDDWNRMRYLLITECVMALCLLFLLMAIYTKILRIRTHFYFFFLKIKRSEAIRKLERIQLFYKDLFETQLFHFDSKIMELLRTDLNDTRKNQESKNPHQQSSKALDFNKEIEEYTQKVMQRENEKDDKENDFKTSYPLEITWFFTIRFAFKNVKKFLLSLCVISILLLFFDLIYWNLADLLNLMDSLLALNFHISEINVLSSMISFDSLPTTIVAICLESALQFRQRFVENFYTYINLINNPTILFFGGFYNTSLSMISDDYSQSLLNDTSFMQEFLPSEPRSLTILNNFKQIAGQNFVNISDVNYFVNNTQEVLKKGFKTMILANVDYNDYLLKFFLNPGLPNSARLIDQLNYLLYKIVSYLLMTLLHNFQSFYLTFFTVLFNIFLLIGSIHLIILVCLLMFMLNLFFVGSQDEIHYGRNMLNLIDDLILEENEALKDMMIHANGNELI